jgi:hypothetical protein
VEHRPLNILMVEDDELDVMNVRRGFRYWTVSELP